VNCPHGRRTPDYPFREVGAADKGRGERSGVTGRDVNGDLRQPFIMFSWMWPDGDLHDVAMRPVRDCPPLNGCVDGTRA
jgi:hypothetical protein